MALVKQVNYVISAGATGGEVGIESNQSRRSLTITQSGEGEMEIHVQFTQLSDLIEALEEIRKTSEIGSGYLNR